MDANNASSAATSGAASVVVINHHHPCWYNNGEVRDKNLNSIPEESSVGTGLDDPPSPGRNMDEDPGSHSDTEVSRICAAGVMIRKKRQPGNCSDEDSRDNERPMSWEGELSDAEISRLDEAIRAGRIKVERAGQFPFSHSSRQMTGAHHLQGYAEDASMEGVQCGGASPPRCSPPPLPLDVKPPQLSDKVLHISTPEQINEQALKSLLPPGSYTPSQSPVTQRHFHKHPPTPSPDSAIHSAYYSPSQSPIASRHVLSSSGFSSPYSTRHATPSLSRTSSDASQYSTGSCYSSSAQFSSPSHSPVQTRHPLHLLAMSPRSREYSQGGVVVHGRHEDEHKYLHDTHPAGVDDNEEGSNLTSGGPGISRQQLINSPCPICGDKISGFHYGIFSCESCKGFFKRTVQNRKNYVCLRGSACPVTVATRKKCPACRFEKCLKAGMKLEAIREDRTRGGRSTYQCSYTLPTNLVGSGGEQHGGNPAKNLPSSSMTPSSSSKMSRLTPSTDLRLKAESGSDLGASGSGHSNGLLRVVPQLLQEIMDVEHLWHHDQNTQSRRRSGGETSEPGREFLRAAAAASGSTPDFIENLCSIADHRLYKIVKWCKSLPLFKHISLDDQISLLKNSWCELLMFSCCFRSMASPGEIRVSPGKTLSLECSRAHGLGPCIERMLNFTEHLRRLKLDKYEYVAMKVIILLASDTPDLQEPEKVRASQEKVLEALQHYTLRRYPEMPSKFGELLLRIPELQRACQVGQEMLSLNNKDSEGPASFDLLMELLRGDH